VTPYLIGGITGLLGVVLALWWRYKLAKAEGEVTKQKSIVQVRDVTIVDQKNLIDSLTAANVANTKQHEEELQRYDIVIGHHTQREEELRALVQQCAVPDVIAARVGKLFPVHKDGDGGKAGDQGGK
jgi:hypothetical protein